MTFLLFIMKIFTLWSCGKRSFWLRDNLFGKPTNSPYCNFSFLSPTCSGDFIVCYLHIWRGISSLLFLCVPCPMIHVPWFLIPNSRLPLTEIDGHPLTGRVTNSNLWVLEVLQNISAALFILGGGHMPPFLFLE